MYKILGGDGKEYGPVSAETLQQWIREGRANAQTQVLPEGESGWKPLGQVPEFLPFLTAPASPALISPVQPVTGSRPGTNPMALTGMILGLCSITFGLLCCGSVMGIAGIVFSAIGLNQISKNPEQQGKGMAIAGLITSILGLIAGIIIGVFFGVLGALGEASK